MGFGVAGVQGMDHDVRVLVIAGVTVLPSALLEVWWKQRSRRRAERLIMPSVKMMAAISRSGEEFIDNADG